MAGGILKDGSASARLAAAITAEFLGVAMFALIGGAAPWKNAPSAWANGIALAAMMWATMAVSGGHLNPAITMGTLITGHISVSRALAYWGAQVAGAITASALHRVLIPKATMVGCFGPGAGATLGQAFGWELLMTMLLSGVYFATAIGASPDGPGTNPAAPAAIGLTLAAAALSSAPLTGAALNPARVLGPAVVFGCGPGAWRAAGAYITAQLIGAAAAACASWPLYGTGPHFGKCRDELDDVVADTREALAGAYHRIEEGRPPATN